MRVGISPEMQALIDCARHRVNGTRAVEAQTISWQALDWPRITQMALGHGMAPMLYWQLRQWGIEALPKTALARLQRAFYHNVYHHDLLRTFDTLSQNLR